MNALLIGAGVLAWGGVAALSIWMADIDEPVWGFFPIAIGVLVAWGIGEAITVRVWKVGEPGD